MILLDWKLPRCLRNLLLKKVLSKNGGLWVRLLAIYSAIFLDSCFINLRMIAQHATIWVQVLMRNWRRWWPSRRYFNFLLHWELVLICVDLLSAHAVLLLTRLKKTSSGYVNVCTIEGWTPNTIQNLQCFLIVIFYKRLDFIFKPFSEVIEVLMSHKLITVRAPFRIKP